MVSVAALAVGVVFNFAEMTTMYVPLSAGLVESIVSLGSVGVASFTVSQVAGTVTPAFFTNRV